MVLFRLTLFFTIGALGFLLFPLSFSLIQETEITEPSAAASSPNGISPIARSLTGRNTIVWKLRDHLTPGTRIRVSAKHSISGSESQLQFVAFSGLRENYEYPRVIAKSASLFATTGTEWSNWELTTTEPVLFIGFTWPQDQPPPVAIEKSAWLNSSSFDDFAYVGKNDALTDKIVPLRANLRLERDEPFLLSSWSWIICLPLLIAGIVIITRRGLYPTTSDLLAFTIGVIFSYRLWALTAAPYWSWGSYTLSLIPAWLGWSLVVLTPIVALTALAWPPAIFTPAVVTHKFPRLLRHADELGMVAALVTLAVLFRCRPIYGDWVYGFTNHTHAPLTSAWFAAWASFALNTTIFPWLESMHMQLVSILVFIPFLFLLFRFVRHEEEDSHFWPAILLLLSGSTLLCFFGEIEVYTVPSLAWLAFAASSFAYLDRRLSLAAPTLLSFLAYLSHVPEALFIFPLIFLWLYDIRTRRPGMKVLALRIFALAASALAITVVHVAALFWFKFEGSLMQLQNATTHWGFEVLWGNFRHPGVVMPFFSVDDTKIAFTRPGPNFPVFSIENLLKVLAFQFHYSMLFFLLPVLILVRDRFRQVRDPKIAFLVISFVVYTVYAAIAYVGWLPLIRDWDLFAVYSFIGAFLTWFLLRSDPDRKKHYAAIIIVNFAQTLVWIGINHYALTLPVRLPW